MNARREAPARSIAAAYARLASDTMRGTQLSPTFDDAVELHRLIDTIERGASLTPHRDRLDP